MGGLYGIVVGKVFCGESMFHKAANTSKLAMLALVELLKSQGAEFIDCQMQNPHLASLGCIEIPRTKFLTMLNIQSKRSFDKTVWQPQTIELDKLLRAKLLPDVGKKDSDVAEDIESEEA